MKGEKCDISDEEIESLKQNFEKDIADCCSKHMPRYMKLKETALVCSKEFHDLVGEMRNIANKILGKIEIVVEVLKSTGRDGDLKQVLERKAFVDGILAGLVEDSKICSI